MYTNQDLVERSIVQTQQATTMMIRAAMLPGELTLAYWKFATSLPMAGLAAFAPATKPTPKPRKAKANPAPAKTAKAAVKPVARKAKPVAVTAPAKPAAVTPKAAKPVAAKPATAKRKIAAKPAAAPAKAETKAPVAPKPAAAKPIAKPAAKPAPAKPVEAVTKPVVVKPAVSAGPDKAKDTYQVKPAAAGSQAKPVTLAAIPEPKSKEPALLKAPKGKSDDLKLIKGVGPKLEEKLNTLGIWHFDQIAAWTPDQRDWVETRLDTIPGRAAADDWVGQAKAMTATGKPS